MVGRTVLYTELRQYVCAGYSLHPRNFSTLFNPVGVDDILRGFPRVDPITGQPWAK